MGMDLRNLTVAGVPGKVSDTGPEEDPTLLFITGPLNSGLWKHQEKYFSKNYRNIVFEPENGERTFLNQKKALERILDDEEIYPAVLISHGCGNKVALELEKHENVLGTVMSGTTGLKSSISSLYSRGLTQLLNQPKLVHKMITSRETKYEVAKRLSEEIELPSSEELQSFDNGTNLRTPVKQNLTIRYSRKGVCPFREPDEKLDGTRTLTISNSGYFVPFERPLEYNKAVSEFLDEVSNFVERRKLTEAKTKHKSLKRFERRLNT